MGSFAQTDTAAVLGFRPAGRFLQLDARSRRPAQQHRCHLLTGHSVVGAELAASEPGPPYFPKPTT